MQASSTVFSQIIATLYRSEFSRCADQFPLERPPRGLSAYDQFLAQIFGQLTYRESLRDIICCLGAKRSLIYHLGFRGRITRTNLAYANHHRDWRVFWAAAQILMRRASRLYQGDQPDPDLPNVAFALDSSIIALSLDLFPWAYYARSRHAAMKLHLMLSLQGNLPAWAALTEADFPDMKVLDQIPAMAGAYYVMDRGYLDFMRLFRLHQAGAFFVVRNRRDVKFRVISSRPVDKCTGLRCDQTISLTSNWSVKSYPQYLRRIVSVSYTHLDVYKRQLLNRDTRHNEINPVCIAARHAEDEALGDGFVLPQSLFDGRRGNLSSSNIDVIARATAQKNLSVFQLGEIAGLEHALGQRRFRFRPVGLTHRAACLLYTSS